jgi:hypothetical protein
VAVKWRYTYIVCVLLLNIIFINTCLTGEGNLNEEGNMNEVKTAYRAIFSHSTRSEYFLTDMSNTYRVNKSQTIDRWLDRNTPYNMEKFAERIVSLLNYDQIAIQISMYLTRKPGGKTTTDAAYDICFTDTDGNITKINLCVSERGESLAFAKIIDNTLCIGLNNGVENSYPVKIDFTDLYTINLDQEGYPVTKYNHNLGEIRNIWIQDDGKMLYASYNGNKLESGIVNISDENDLELIELFGYSIVEYDTASNQMIGFDSNGQLFYRDSGQNIHVLNNVRGTVYQAFFLESDKIIICSYIERDHIIGNFLFGGKNVYRVYSYYTLYSNNKGSFSVKRIDTINQLWRLEQVTRQ